MTNQENNPPCTLGRATEAVRDVTGVVQATTQSISKAMEAGRRPGRVLDRLTRFTRHAPLGSLAIAFLAGLMFARRR